MGGRAQVKETSQSVCLSLNTINECVRKNNIHNVFLNEQITFVHNHAINVDGGHYRLCPSVCMLSPVLIHLNPCHGNPDSFASASLYKSYQAGPCPAERVTWSPHTYSRTQGTAFTLACDCVGSFRHTCSCTTKGSCLEAFILFTTGQSCPLTILVHFPLRSVRNHRKRHLPQHQIYSGHCRTKSTERTHKYLPGVMGRVLGKVQLCSGDGFWQVPVVLPCLVKEMCTVQNNHIYSSWQRKMKM